MTCELKRLRAWKAEAMAVLNEWEAAWDAAGRPGPLGVSKARATTAEIVRLREDNEHLRWSLSQHRLTLPTTRKDPDEIWGPHDHDEPHEGTDP